MLDLRTFALSNSRCCQLAERRLWYSYRVHPGGDADHSVLSCLKALIRLGRRTRLVRRLVIGPCSWTWNDTSLTMLPMIWRATVNLREVFLEMPDPIDRKLWYGGEFAPVLRSLTRDGSHLKLDVFKYEGWLVNQSFLFDFLNTQPSITRVVGIDVCDPELFAPPSTFLPALQSIVCSKSETVRALANGRPLNSLEIRDWTNLSDIKPLLNTLSDHLIALQSLRFRFDHTEDPNTPYLITSPREALTTIIGALPSLRCLEIDPLHIEKEDLEMLKDLPALEILGLGGGVSDWDVEDELSAWDTVVGPSLQRMIFSRYGKSLVKPSNSSR